MRNEKDHLLYELTAKDYDQQRFSGVAGSWGHYRQISVLSSILGDVKGKKILEIGCGTGRITRFLATCGAVVTATDISPEMLKVAQDRFKDYDLPNRPEFREMSVFDIDVDLGTYDYIIMVNVLGRLSSAKTALRGIAEKMSLENKLIFSFPCLTSAFFLFGILVNIKGKSLSRDVTSRWYCPWTIEGYCKEVGMRVGCWAGNYYIPFPKMLFWTFPVIVLLDVMFSRFFSKLCPSVFVESFLVK